MERLLNDLVSRLQKAHGEQLVSVVLYGSAAAAGADQLSDINVLCVLRQVTPAELGAAESVFRWWRDKGNPAPLLLSDEELHGSTDCFPIEFTDIRAQHRILHGADLVKDLEIDYTFYRAEVEHELRAKLLRLRQKAAGLLSDDELLTRLMADSVSTFCVMFRHALLLGGWPEPKFAKRDVIAAAAQRFGCNPQPFNVLLDIRDGKKRPREITGAQLFAEYLAQIQIVTDAVDTMER